MKITKEQILDIESKLKAWRDERHLAQIKQGVGLKGNFFEEVAELYRAKTNAERVDAFCDMCVFVLNAHNVSSYIVEIPLDNFVLTNFEEQKMHDTIEDMLLSFMNNAFEKVIQLAFSCIYMLGFNPYLCMLETIKEISSRTGKYDESIDKFIKDKGVYSIDELYDILEADTNLKHYEVLELENIYKVSVKYHNEKEAVLEYAKWYGANYSLCRI